MQMMYSQKICLIAPYADLAQIAKRVNADRHLGLTVREGILEKGVEQAQAAAKNGTRVLISRGGTAAMIRQHIEIPVVEIKVTGYDVLRVLAPERGYSTPVGVVGYRNVVEGCQRAAEMLGIPTKEVIIETSPEQVDWQNIQSRMQSFIESYGIRLVVGDSLVLGRVRLGDVNVRLIASGEEAILQAYEEATHLIRVIDEEKKQTEQFRVVLDFVHDGVIAINETGHITVINPVASEILGIHNIDVIGKPLRQLIRNTRLDKVLQSGVAEIDQLHRLKNTRIVTNRVPIVVNGRIHGAVATFQEVKKLQDAEQKIRQDLYAKGLTTKYTFRDILSGDERIRRLIRLAKVSASTNDTVVVQGASGTGKELFAQAIHAAGTRSRGPFVAVNCSALPPNLLESELFGYVEGAFTGAKKGGKPGLFELAHGGTVFLDEIGDMDKGVQARILRVLEERQVMRIGSDSFIPVDIRVIAATHADLASHVQSGSLRLDLFYRLNVLTLNVPPLRERQGDIFMLARYFAQRYCHEHGKQIEDIPADIFDVLAKYHWPGNIRQLKNVMERVVLFCGHRTSGRWDLELMIPELRIEMVQQDMQPVADADRILGDSLEEIKRGAVRRVLWEEKGNKTKAAKRLGVDRSTIERLM